MSSSRHLLLPRPFYQAMLAHAQSEHPNECCGLHGGLIENEGKTLRVMKSYALVNELASPIAYRSEPRSLFEAHKDMRMHQYEMLAVYHSHPTTPPLPSRTDLEQSYSPDVVHFIISLLAPDPLMRGWWLSESNKYEEACWQIVET